MPRSTEQYRKQERIACECGESVNIDRHPYHIQTKKHLNKIAGRTVAIRVRELYQTGKYIECSCGKSVNRYYIMKHLRDTQSHRKGQNPVNVNELAKFLAYNCEGLKL